MILFLLGNLNRLSKKGSSKGRSPFGINSSPSPLKERGIQGVRFLDNLLKGGLFFGTRYTKSCKTGDRDGSNNGKSAGSGLAEPDIAG